MEEEHEIDKKTLRWLEAVSREEKSLKKMRWI